MKPWPFAYVAGTAQLVNAYRAKVSDARASELLEAWRAANPGLVAMWQGAAPLPVSCPLPTYRCACKGNWCRLLQRNLP